MASLSFDHATDRGQRDSAFRTSLQIDPTRLALILKKLDACYDPSHCMIWGEVPDIHYHTRFEPGTRVHTVRDTAEYAFALLEAHEEWRVRRAEDVLCKLVDLQDACETSRTYGIWSWFYEEPLGKMRPPDWNWADFIGAQLVQILWRNSSTLDCDVRAKVAEAIRRASLSIIRRDVGMDYTNIAIMGTYVTLMTGEILGDEAILEYGRQRLRKFSTFTAKQGGFPEYNSPNYTIVALTELSRMLRDFTRNEDLKLVREIHDLAWKEVASHWHVASQQWAGPHSRAYQTLLTASSPGGTLGFLQRGLGDHVRIVVNPRPSLQEDSLPIHCPKQYIGCFLEAGPARMVRQDILNGTPPLQAATYLAENFSISSVDRGTFWNQARALVAYARNSDGPTAMHLRFLRNGYDYSSANVLASQEGPNILAGICFANDGGNVHCNLDRIENRTVEAEDWRLRIELQGSVCAPQLPESYSTGHQITFTLGDNARVSLRIPWLRFGDLQPRWEVYREGAKIGLDLVLYSGAVRSFVFDDSFTCAMGLAITIDDGDTDADLGAVSCYMAGSRLFLKWPFATGKALTVATPTQPSKEQDIISFARENVEGFHRAGTEVGNSQK